ncbi:hypothetical protein T11_10053, partial [Trichinella zimbabwensis]
LNSAPHADDCAPDNDILYKMEKKSVLKRRAAKEMKTVPQIYHEEASSASADLQTAGLFPTYKSVKTAMYSKRAQRFPRLPPTRQQLEIPPQWRITESGRQAFLPLPEVPTAVDLFGRNVTGSVAALYGYFRREWMAPNRMQLWNVYNVQIRTNNHLEGWHFKVNQQARKHYLSFYELLQLLIDEQCSTETLIQQVTSKRVTADDLQIKNEKYEQQQQRITALTVE